MRFAVKSAVCLVIILAGVALVGCRQSPSGRPWITINGRSWQVELATTVEQQARGLAGRSQISPDEGMFFVFPRARYLNFWMQGCLVDLDVAFIGPDMRVISVHTMRANPGGPYASCGPPRPAQYALEVRAGALAAGGVRPGHDVQFSVDTPSAAKASPNP